MKTRFTILLLFVSFVAVAQEREPLTVVVSGNLEVYKRDNSKGYTKYTTITKLQKGDSLTLVRPFFTDAKQISEIAVPEGYVSGERLKQTLGDSEFQRYWDWICNVKSQNKQDENSFEAKQARMQASMKMMSKANTWHEYLTVFTGDFELNFSHNRLLDFLYNKMQMSETSNDFEDNCVVSKCVERTSKGNPENLTIRYKVRSEAGYFFPTQVEITGTSRRVIQLFILYWPTNIQIEEVKRGNEYISYMLPDKVTLSIDKAGKAKITITNNN